MRHRFLSLPHKSTMSRWRLLVGTAFMLVRRKSVSRGHVYLLQVDSSPQGGRDYELMIVSSICEESLPECFRAANELIGLRFTQGVIGKPLSHVCGMLRAPFDVPRFCRSHSDIWECRAVALFR